MDRRKFLKAASASVGSLGLLAMGCADGDETPAPTSTPAAPTMRTLGPLGVQLYTLRGLMQEDLVGTIEQVAEIGYKELEFAGYFDHSPEDIRALLDRLGLTAPSAHVGLQILESDLEGALNAAEVIGHNYIIAPWLAPDQRTAEGYAKLAEDCNRYGAACKERGIQFGYHNHDFEFEEVDGAVAFDTLLENTDPDLVVIELDLFWIVKAGKDPLDYFARYPGRFHLCHVKDMADIGGEENMVSVGAGEIDFASIFAASEQAGLKHYIVEHDNPEDPIASIQASYNYLQDLQIG